MNFHTLNLCVTNTRSKKQNIFNSSDFLFCSDYPHPRVTWSERLREDINFACHVLFMNGIIHTIRTLASGFFCLHYLVRCSHAIVYICRSLMLVGVLYYTV